MASHQEHRVPPVLHGDEPVIATNDDASVSKRYAVSKGYWKDPYIQLFCRTITRKAPEISLGYFARVMAVRSAVESFLGLHSGHGQVVSLGAGYDTTFWNLLDTDLQPAKYIEVDFPAVTRQKTHIIHGKRAQLLDKLGEVKVIGSKMGIISPCYSVLPCDLKDEVQLRRVLVDCQVDYDAPTLVLSECVLMYIPAHHVNSLLNLLSHSFTHAVYISYDTVNMTDRFAEVMLSNLSNRQCTLHTEDCQSAETQCKRFHKAGWTHCHVYDMNEISQRIPDSEWERVRRLEFLDEVDPLHQLMSHYCICVASVGLHYQLEEMSLSLTNH